MTILTGLDRELADARRTISSDGYPMSIGELTNMYRDKELIIRPEFQRFFRWNTVQKSRLVESIMLGIPLPSIFVAQTSNGVWEVVDGLQRISTILQLQGELLDKDENRTDELILTATKYLPSLEGKQWSGPNRLSDAQKLDIKRSKIDIKIVKRESSPQTKFDLFQRLNSYGSTLNSQEMRSALLVGASPEFFAWLEGLASHPTFVSATSLSDRLIEERYDLELVTRFLVLHNRPQADLTLSKLRDLPQVLDDTAVEMAVHFPADTARLETIFKLTFDIVMSGGGEDVFRRWDAEKNEFKGSFLNSAFEVVGLGLGFRIANGLPFNADLIEVAKKLWSTPKMQKGFATGRSTESRLIDFIPMGRALTEP
jgi:hypothetical protein